MRKNITSSASVLKASSLALHQWLHSLPPAACSCGHHKPHPPLIHDKDTISCFSASYSVLIRNVPIENEESDLEMRESKTIQQVYFTESSSSRAAISLIAVTRLHNPFSPFGHTVTCYSLFRVCTANGSHTSITEELMLYGSSLYYMKQRYSNIAYMILLPGTFSCTDPPPTEHTS